MNFPSSSRLCSLVAFAVVLAVAPARAATEAQIVDQGKSLYDNGKYKELRNRWFATSR